MSNSDTRNHRAMMFLMTLGPCADMTVVRGSFLDNEHTAALREDAQRAHVVAEELHTDFLLGVAQAEEMAQQRPLREMADTLLSDELLWARSELQQADRVQWMAGCARRLTLLRLEEDFRREAYRLIDAAALFEGASVLGSTFK